MPVNTHQQAHLYSNEGELDSNQGDLYCNEGEVYPNQAELYSNTADLYSNIQYWVTAFYTEKNSKKHHSCCVQSVKQPHSKMAHRIQ